MTSVGSLCKLISSANVFSSNNLSRLSHSLCSGRILIFVNKYAPTWGQEPQPAFQVYIHIHYLTHTHSSLFKICIVTDGPDVVPLIHPAVVLFKLPLLVKGRTCSFVPAFDFLLCKTCDRFGNDLVCVCLCLLTSGLFVASCDVQHAPAAEYVRKLLLLCRYNRFAKRCPYVHGSQAATALLLDSGDQH